MRNEYSIVIEHKESEHFKEVLAQMGIKWLGVHGSGGLTTYQVNLSKYELLYLRLACKVGKIKAVNFTTVEADFED